METTTTNPNFSRQLHSPHPLLAAVNHTTLSTTTDNPQLRSARTLEKQIAGQNPHAFDHAHPQSTLQTSKRTNYRPKAQRSLRTGRAQPAQRTSFLDIYLARQQKRKSREGQSATSRVLNPINHVPRPTPVAVRKTTVASEEGANDVHTLLTLPEQRRSRQHSPTTAVVEHSPVLDPDDLRTSSPLPRTQQHARFFPFQDPVVMSDLEKSNTDGVAPPERAHIPTSKYNPLSNTPQTPSVLRSTYGVNPLDDAPHPPRRVTSQRSLREHQSTASLRSATLPRKNSEAPPLPSQYDGASNYAANADDPEQGDEVAEELAWGPSHPCYPHSNPHVPLSSPEYHSTRIIRIRRDWMVVGDLAPAYSNIYPEILDPAVNEAEFRRIIQHVNTELVQAFDPYSTWNWFDGLLGLLTGWFWEDLRPGGVKGRLKGLERWIEDWNHTVGAGDGVKIIPLRRTGYMNLDIQIPDPQIRVLGEGDSVRRTESGR